MRARLLDQCHDREVVARMPTRFERAELERRARLREARAVFTLGLLVGAGAVVSVLSLLGLA